MKTPTLPQFKAWARSHKGLAEAVCMAQAFAQCERERVEAYILPLFLEWDFKDEKGQPITDPKHLYRCRDEEYCAAYYKACDNAHRQHGFTGKDGHCPALVAEELQRIAERALIDAGCVLMGIDPANLWDMKNRDKMLDLLLGACLKKDERRAA